MVSMIQSMFYNLLNSYALGVGIVSPHLRDMPRHANDTFLPPRPDTGVRRRRHTFGIYRSTHLNGVMDVAGVAC